MLLQVNLLASETIVIEPEERFTKVDSFCLFQAPCDRLEFFKPWTQIFFRCSIEIVNGMFGCTVHAVSRKPVHIEVFDGVLDELDRANREVFFIGEQDTVDI